MKAQIPVGTAKAETTGQYGPATWANVRYYVIGDTSGHTPGDVIQTVAQAEHEFYTVGFGTDEISSDMSVTFTTVTYRDAADSIIRLRVADAIAGANGSGDQEANVAYLVNWATGDPRRGGKPRSYVPGVADNRLVDSARIGPAVVTTINGRLVTWLASLPTPAGGRLVALQLVEMSFTDGKAFRATPVTFPIIGGTLNNVVATQRRRVDRLRLH